MVEFTLSKCDYKGKARTKGQVNGAVRWWVSRFLAICSFLICQMESVDYRLSCLFLFKDQPF